MTFLDDVAQALLVAVRSLEVDEESSTIDVTSASAGRVLAVVRPIARGVTFYVVHPRPVPAEALGPVGELAVRVTADLMDAALELDLATAVVAARYSVVLGDLELDVDQLAGLLDAALEVVESVGARYASAIDAVIDGEVDPRSAAVAVRTAPLEELAATVADPDGPAGRADDGAGGQD